MVLNENDKDSPKDSSFPNPEGNISTLYILTEAQAISVNPDQTANSVNPNQTAPEGAV